MARSQAQHFFQLLLLPSLLVAFPSPSLRDGSYGYTAVLVVPTGVGAAIGGYAGDALPLTRVMVGSGLVDTLITHPNVMNGASLYWPWTSSTTTGSSAGVLYTEGYAVDAFCRGEWGLLPFERGGRGGHKIGLILDGGMEEDMRTRHLQVQ